MTAGRAPAIDPSPIARADHYARHGYPHETWERLRRESPVLYVDLPFRGGYVVSRYDDVGTKVRSNGDRQAQAELAELLCKNSFAERAFFCNSGAEANEASVKLARIYQKQKKGEGCYEILTMEKSFHGRTLATLAATGSAKYLEGFGPPMDGFDQVPHGDLEAVKKAIGPQTAGIPGEIGFRQPHRQLHFPMDQRSDGLGSPGKVDGAVRLPAQTTVARAAAGNLRRLRPGTQQRQVDLALHVEDVVAVLEATSDEARSIEESFNQALVTAIGDGNTIADLTAQNTARMAEDMAAIAAETDNPPEVARQINGITRDGESCETFADCVALLEEGTDIDYNGPSGPQDFSQPGEPTAASFAIQSYGENNRIDDAATEYRQAQL